MTQTRPAPPRTDDAPDASLSLEGTAARCSLWWRNAPPVPGERVGVIGHYEASDDDDAARLLDRALATLAAHGCTLAIGPMDGATWRDYRAVTEAGTEPSFFGEPRYTEAVADQFRAAGFEARWCYRSHLIDDLTRLPSPDEALPDGYALRTLDAGRLDDELATLYDLTLTAFDGTPLYTPPPRAAFLQHYRAVAARVPLDGVLILEYEGTPVGYCFSLPASPDTLILKTAGVHPDHAAQRLGTHMIRVTQDRARRQGYRRAIHALMRDDNPSTRFAGPYGRLLRRYALFAHPLP